ncbi:MAG: glycosyltransferase family 4 protein [Candidatus Bathyarchaeia archaeon]|jgi:glycosyltransferase involved in cell wall biosynthesis
MANILVTSASHDFTDYRLSSEGVSCYNIFKHLEKFGYQFEAISAQVHIKQPLNNVHIHRIGTLETSPTSNMVKKYFNHIEVAVRSYQKALQVLQKQKIDIIHHMLPAVYNQTFDVLALLKRNRKQPFVFGPTSAHIYPRPLDEKMLQEITGTIHRKTVQNCDRLITISDQVKTYYAKSFDPEKIWTIPLGVDSQVFSPAKRGTEKDGHEILFAGYLYKLKGVEYLIKAVNMVKSQGKDVKLRIVGNGPDKKRLVRLVETLQMENVVTFEGLVPHTLMPEYYRRCNVFCFPTLGEPFGKVVIEAMACAKPVIASNIGGPTEIIEDNKTGLLVPPANPEILAERIIELLEDETKTKQLGANARNTVIQRYSWEKIADSYHRLYESLI